MCERIAKQPYFDMDMVVGQPWRIYYTWNLKLDTACLEMQFKNASLKITNRIWSEMNEYLEQQPNWDAATLLLTMSPSKHELLLFADQGPAGSFVAVPNIASTSNMTPSRKSISLMKFTLKFLQDGQFLLFVDCQGGVGSLSARPDRTPYRSEIETAVAGLKIGDGFPACTKERNGDEQFLAK
ncbi:unnamed protein product [Leptosia nina]|uniref:Uncharacterized protein n=1 Tax=Leptosia nina TaxID=320188 RepID=A0AAV1J052_9NEOP